MSLFIVWNHQKPPIIASKVMDKSSPGPLNLAGCAAPPSSGRVWEHLPANTSGWRKSKEISALQHSEEPCSSEAVQCTVQCSVVQWRALQCSTWHCIVHRPRLWGKEMGTILAVVVRICCTAKVFSLLIQSLVQQLCQVGCLDHAFWPPS